MKVKVREPRQSSHPSDPGGVVSSAQLAMSLQAVQYDLCEDFKFTFSHALTSICSTMNAIIGMLRVDILNDPTMAARSLFGRSDLHAVAGGGVIEVYPCIEIEKRQYSFRAMNQTCTELVPVTFQVLGTTHLGYLQPHTNILVHQSPPADCKMVAEIPLQFGPSYYLYKSKTGHVRHLTMIRELRFPSWNASIENWLGDVHIFRQIVMYNWSKIQTRISMNDLMSQLENHDQVLQALSTNFRTGQALAADDIAENIVAKGYFGFLRGLRIDAWQIWTFICCLYVSLFAFIIHCCPTALTKRLEYSLASLVLVLYNGLAAFVQRCIPRNFRPQPANMPRFRTRRPADRILSPSHELQALTPRTNPPPYSPTSPAPVSPSEVSELNPPKRNLRIAVVEAEPSSTPSSDEYVLFPLPKVQFHIEGLPIMALVDSGSALTLVSQRTAKYLKHCAHYPPKVQATSFTGDHVTLSCCLRADLKIGPNHTTRWFHVMEDNSYDCVLGNDILRDPTMQVVQDNAQNRLTVLGHHLPYLPSSDYSAITTVPVYTLDPHVTVEARTESMIPSTTQGSKTGEFLFEPNPLLGDLTGIDASRALVFVKKGLLPVRIRNVSLITAVLLPTILLGTLTPWDSKCLENPTASIQVIKEIPDHVSSIPPKDLDEAIAHLPGPFRLELQKLLRIHSDLFAQNEFDLGECTTMPFSIQTGDHPPISQRAYPLPFAQRERVKNMVEIMRKTGIIEPSVSPWAAPIILIRKKQIPGQETQWRFCVDYRKLNAITRKDSYPLPLIHEVLTSLRGAQYFTNLDLAQGYLQISLDNESKTKTAFICHEGLWQFRRLPFGVTGGPSWCQRLMNCLLSGLNWQICICYLDDIIIFSPDFDKHLIDISTVFSRLKHAGLKLRLKKCSFAKAEIAFLGHVVSKNGIAPDPKRVMHIQEMVPPTTIKELCTFLGISSYYRRHIVEFSKRARPLNQLLTKDHPFHWTPNCQRAFEDLKLALVTAPVLAYPDFRYPFILQTDASLYGFGAVLRPNIVGNDRPIAYASRTLVPA